MYWLIKSKNTHITENYKPFKYCGEYLMIWENTQNIKCEHRKLPM